MNQGSKTEDGGGAARASSPKKSVEKETRIPKVQELVYRELRRAIMRGAFQPGQMLTVREVSEVVGTSPTPIREALRQLVSEQALERLPNGRIRVPLMSRQDYQELVKIRVMLEGEAAREACRQADDTLIAAMEKIYLAGREQKAAGDLEQYITSNYDFHFLAYNASSSALLVSLIEMCWLRSGPFIHQIKHFFYGPTRDHHATLIEAMRSRNGEMAAKAIRDDIQDTADKLLRLVTFHEDPFDMRVALDPIVRTEAVRNKNKAENPPAGGQAGA